MGRLKLKKDYSLEDHVLQYEAQDKKPKNNSKKSKKVLTKTKGWNIIDLVIKKRKDEQMTINKTKTTQIAISAVLLAEAVFHGLMAWVLFTQVDHSIVAGIGAAYSVAITGVIVVSQFFRN